MLRHDMVDTVGKEFLTSNIEAGEYSYVQAAGGKSQLEAKVGHSISHFKLDRCYVLYNRSVEMS